MKMESGTPQPSQRKTFLPTVPWAWDLAIIFGYLFAVFAMVVDTLIAWQLEPPRAFNFGLCILGGSLGWMVGILLSPYPGETPRFNDYMKGISTLFSGYILAKLDCWFGDKSSVVIPMIVAGRMMVFAIAFIIFVILVFVTRTYVGSYRGEVDKKTTA